jgi:NAD+ synthetase
MIKKRFNYKDLFDSMVNFTFEYIKNNKLESAILGISGGIDSTVVAALLYEVGKKFENEVKENIFKFYGFSLPTNTTNSKEYFVSTLVGNTFCQHSAYTKPFFETININGLSETIFHFCFGNELYDSDIDRFRYGNIKSRLRMIYLYDKAKEYKGFVVGTDNYTEKLLGFSTIGGDALADYMPLQNLWKTEVYGLAKYLLEKYKIEENWAAVNAINESINLIPQDGLGISTSDMEQIGAKDYYEVDEILYQYEKYLEYLDMGGYEDRFDSIVIEPLVAGNHKREVIDKVLNRRKNNFKLNLPLEFNYNID